ncbi:hypothetical protein B0H14DRAFT_1335972 [Mycena olivaceomarginata]|nr:hypothetical protein B0H14DRAFT_1335972 [Mycena olivaceomarginata]
MSTGAKAAIGAASGAAALLLIAALVLVRRRNTNKRRAGLSRAAGGKEDPWYADDDLPMQPRAPFMATADRRHSAQPSEMSTDTAMTLAPGRRVQSEVQRLRASPATGRGRAFRAVRRGAFESDDDRCGTVAASAVAGAIYGPWG